MDSSEQDATIAHDEQHEGEQHAEHDVIDPRQEDDSVAQPRRPNPSVNPPQPAPPATPGIYEYTGIQEGVTHHQVLNELKPGKNDFTGVVDPVILQALGELVAAGVMRQV